MKKILLIIMIMLLAAAPIQAKAVSSPSIIINLPARLLSVYSGEQLVQTYPIAIGSAATPTPLGNYSILTKEINPWWYDPDIGGKVVTSGPYNPLGYRWMGIGGNYGIHGTNMPWSIGKAVSHGCVRMNESDVEELFDMVSYGTPVKIVYDRIKLDIDESNNKAVIGLYPDVYGYGTVSLGQMKAKIKAFGLLEIVDDNTLNNVLVDGSEVEIQLAKRVSLRVNGIELANSALEINGKVLVPVWSVASAILCDLTWDKKNEQVSVGTRVVSGEVRKDIIYVTPDAIQTLFGGEYTKIGNVLEYNITSVFVNGKREQVEVIKQDGMLHLSAEQLASVLGRKANWDEKAGKFRIDGKEVPISFIANKPYVKIVHVMDYFSSYLYWNQNKARIDVTYSMKAI